MTALKLDVAIVGGGPGGLAAAISLQRAVPGITLKVVYLCVYPCCMCVCVGAV
jgi:cation diffusion facilitator CzcD-associated flavoprotein CzcO